MSRIKFVAKNKMPRKKKSTAAAEKKPKATYHKSKNGRYYKKTTLPSGKCQCRFVSKKEAEASGAGSSDTKRRKAEKSTEEN